jgi:SNF2 family DNA or RNA helicase
VNATADDIDVLLAVRDKEIRRQAARIKKLDDVELPAEMQWRTDSCDRHETALVDCEYRACGGPLWKHQRVGISWLYFVWKGGVLDGTGTGKTNQPIGLVELLRARGEPHRALIVCGSTGAVKQWANEFRRFTPHLHVETGTGTPRDRVQRYSGNWDAMIISAHIMLRDRKILAQLDFDILVEDDVDPIRHGGGSNAKMTQTSIVYNELALKTKRVVNMNATALQIELMDLYWTAVSLGGFEEFGSPKTFERRYIRKEPYSYYDRRTGRTVRGFRIVGYRNMNEFKEKFGPFFIRRTYEDVEGDVAMPTVMPPEDVWLDLTVPQRQRYSQLQEGVLRIIQEQGEHVRVADALAQFGYGRMIISGLQNLDDGDSDLASVKLNWLENKMFGEWSDEKVVVFSQYKGTIRAMRDRFRRRGCDLALIWGDHQGDKAAAYEAEVEKFWQDPRCRIAVGTTAIERSLNLQVARIIVNYDLLLNPQRMTQILGRIKRGGSRHKRVYVFNLMARETQEEGYPDILERRAALHSFVFDDTSELFHSLSPIELLTLIRP